MRPNWSQILRPASFRGVAFQVEKEGIKDVGRNIAVHDYVQAETHDTEDNGKKSSVKYNITAYIANNNAQTASAALITACQTAGIGDLVLPFTGTVSVRCMSCETSHEKTKLGYVAFELEFVAAGGDNTAFSILALQDRLAESLLEDFATLAATALSTSTNGSLAALAYASGIGQQMIGLLVNTITLVPDAAPRNQLADTLSSAAIQFAVAYDTKAYANAMQLTLSSVRTVCRLSNNADIAPSLQMLSANLSQIIPATQSPGLNLQRQFATKAALMVESAYACEALLAGARANVNAPQNTPLTPKINTDSLRERLSNQTSIEVYSAINDVMSLVAQYDAQNRRSLAPLVQVKTLKSLPATALAFALYGDVSRAQELIQLNAISTPAFMPTTLIAFAS